MRYLGNKSRLLSFIDGVIKKYSIEGEVFADIFSGTCSVGDYFKDSYEVIANDFLYYSYLISIAKIKNASIPDFKHFKNKFDLDIFEWLNNVKPTPNGNYFVYNNYTPKGSRMFFTEENGARIDAIRLEIENLYKRELVNEVEYAYLIASLLENVTKVANTSGTFEAYFKFWESRSKNVLKLEPLEINNTSSLKNNSVFNCNANELVRKISGDIAYIDPPYTVSQYVSAYHMLETIAKYDYPTITGIGGKRDRGNKNSLYARRNTAFAEFEDLFRQLKFKHILVSYSTQGLLTVDELTDLASKFAKDGVVHIEYQNYQEYQNHRSSNKSNGKSLKECIIYFEKDFSVNKSPLNYSGSKDTMMEKIIPELPQNISVFVDVMGGAFNVGANIVATEKVIYNDYNKQVFGVIELLLNEDKDKLCSDVENIIQKFNLNKRDKEAYLKLRQDYNLSPTPLKLFVLHMYAFQNMIRFNRALQYNVPVGVAGYSEDLKKRILDFTAKSKTVELLSLDYKYIDYLSYPKDTLFYFDPPYFITSAAYNDGNRGYTDWNAHEESKLLSILSMLNQNGFKFILSNVLEHKGKKNHLLEEWSKENNFIIREIGISGWRYAKNEVLIKNYEN